MKKFLLLIIIITATCLQGARAQQSVGIGTTTPNAAAALDVSSTSKAFLPPRMTTAQMNAIASPAAGMIVYDMDVQALRLYNGTEWQILGVKPQSLGDAPGAFNTIPVSGTASLYNYYFNSDRVRMGPNKSVYFVAVMSGGTVTIGGNTFTSSGYNSIFGKIDSNGNVLWTKFLGPAGAYGVDLDVDASGNVYLCGGFVGTCDFDPGAGTQNLTSAGNYDIFYARYDASGNYVWAQRIGGTSSEMAQSIATDGTYVYLTGYYSGTVAFQGTNLSSVSGSQDIFVAKYSASTGLIGSGWTRSIGGSGSEYPTRVKPYGGGVIVAGTYNGSCTFSTITKTSAGGQDAFFAIYNSFGTVSSVNSIGGTGIDYVNDMATDALGNIFLCGSFSASPLGLGAGSTLTNPGANITGYVVGYNSSLNLSAVRQVGGTTGSDYAYSIALDAAGNVYVGALIGSTDYNVSGRTTSGKAGYNAAAIIKCNSSLYPQWMQLADSYNTYYNDFVSGLDVSADGNTLFAAVNLGDPTFYIGFDGQRHPCTSYFGLARYKE